MSTGFKSEVDNQDVKLGSKALLNRFGFDAPINTQANGPYSTLRTPSSKGLFGSTIDDAELLFAVEREPAAFKIVYGIAKDILDNWFTVVNADGTPNVELDRKLQGELKRLNAKQKLIKLVALGRLFGYSLLILGYSDNTSSLNNAVSDFGSRILYMEPYSKVDIKDFKEVTNVEDERLGYPEYYVMNKGNNKIGTVDVHYTRGLLYSPIIVDHRYKGWSVLRCLYDDLTGFRYMRWGLYMTMIRYGSGFPDITLKGAEATEQAIEAFIASGQFDNLNAMKYFVHNESQELNFKGTGNEHLDPTNYYQVALETLSVGSGIPEPILRGAQAGSLSGSEVNERAYFKYLSDEQSGFEEVLYGLLDRLIYSLGLASPENPLPYKVVWHPSYEESPKEKVEIAVLQAQAAVNELNFKTVDEIRASRFGLPPLPFGEGKVVIGLQHSTQLSVEGEGAAEAVGSEVPNVSRTLPALMRDLGKKVIDGVVSREDAEGQGKMLISQYAKLEREHALLYIKNKVGVDLTVVSPEMEKKLKSEEERFIKDLHEMLVDAEKLFLKRKSEAV